MSKIKILIMSSVGEVVEQMELSYTAGKNAKWYNHFRKQFGNFIKKAKHVSTLDSVIPLLDIYPRETKAFVHTKPC